MNNIKSFFAKCALFSTFIPAVVWFSDWLPKAIDHPEFAPLLSCVYMILIFVAFAHLTHRFLFHKINLQALAIRSIDEKNLPAAVIFFSIILLFIAIIFSLTMLLK